MPVQLGWERIQSVMLGCKAGCGPSLPPALPSPPPFPAVLPSACLPAGVTHLCHTVCVTPKVGCGECDKVCRLQATYLAGGRVVQAANGVPATGSSHQQYNEGSLAAGSTWCGTEWRAGGPCHAAHPASWRHCTCFWCMQPAAGCPGSAPHLHTAAQPTCV